MIAACGAALLSGCATVTGNSYCDIARPHYFNSEDTVDWLIDHDRALLVDVTVHNETYERLCPQ